MTCTLNCVLSDTQWLVLLSNGGSVPLPPFNDDTVDLGREPWQMGRQNTDVVDAVDEAHCTMHDACSFRKHFHCNDWLNPRNDSLLCKCQTSEHDRN